MVLSYLGQGLDRWLVHSFIIHSSDKHYEELSIPRSKRRYTLCIHEGCTSGWSRRTPKSTSSGSPKAIREGCKKSRHLGWTLRAGLPSGGRAGRHPPTPTPQQSRGTGSRKWKTSGQGLGHRSPGPGGARRQTWEGGRTPAESGRPAACPSKVRG